MKLPCQSLKEKMYKHVSFLQLMMQLCAITKLNKEGQEEKVIA